MVFPEPVPPATPMTSGVPVNRQRYFTVSLAVVASGPSGATSRYFSSWRFGAFEIPGPQQEHAVLEEAFRNSGSTVEALLEQRTGAFVVHLVQETGGLVEDGGGIIGVELLVGGEVGRLGFIIAEIARCV